jgi:signal transduction histidine kinase
MSFRFLRSLHFKIASGVIATVLFLIAIYFVWDYRQFSRQTKTEAQEAAENISEITMNSIIELAMLGRHPEMLRGALQRLASVSYVRKIQILDLSGNVRFSSDPSTLDRTYNLQEEECSACHRQSPEIPKTTFLEFNENQILRFTQTIPNRLECHGCHNPEDSNVGLLIVDYPTGDLRARLQSNFYKMLVKSGTMALAVLLVLGFLLNRIVISRIKRLTAIASNLPDLRNSPDLDSVSGSDEIGQLSSSFQKMARRLNDYCKDLEEKEQVRVSLLERLVHSQEEERKSISRELHDQLGQSLSALLLKFQTEFKSNGHSNELLVESKNQIRKLIEDVHKLAWQMRPSILDDYGLDKALERYVEEFSKNASIQTDFQFSGPESLNRLPVWVETTLYRIAQEALTNISKHAEASRASLVLIRTRSNVTLLIEDNGRGFDPNEVKPNSEHGLGILGMRERVSQCGGSLDIEAVKLRGATIRVKIPLEQEQR